MLSSGRKGKYAKISSDLGSAKCSGKENLMKDSIPTTMKAVLNTCNIILTHILEVNDRPLTICSLVKVAYHVYG